MIDAEEAVKKGRSYFDAVLAGGTLREVLLEEVDMVDDGRFWLVTFGFDWQPESGTSSIGPGDRKYKAVKLDAESGRVMETVTP